MFLLYRRSRAARLISTASFDTTTHGTRVPFVACKTVIALNSRSFPHERRATVRKDAFTVVLAVRSVRVPSPRLRRTTSNQTSPTRPHPSSLALAKRVNESLSPSSLLLGREASPRRRRLTRTRRSLRDTPTPRVKSSPTSAHPSPPPSPSSIHSVSHSFSPSPPLSLVRARVRDRAEHREL